MNFQLTRLRAGDEARAKQLFTLMAGIFDEAPAATLSDAFVVRLLASDDFWVIGAWSGEELVGGITAHTLPMTRSESFEIFVYDIAVRSEYQRRGVGRLLMTELRVRAAALGIPTLFVAADDEDEHALDFYRALGGKAAPVTMFSFE